jgi:hypothetical protein
MLFDIMSTRSNMTGAQENLEFFDRVIHSLYFSRCPLRLQLVMSPAWCFHYQHGNVKRRRLSAATGTSQPSTVPKHCLHQLPPTVCCLTRRPRIACFAWYIHSFQSSTDRGDRAHRSAEDSDVSEGSKEPLPYTSRGVTHPVHSSPPLPAKFVFKDPGEDSKCPREYPAECTCAI